MRLISFTLLALLIPLHASRGQDDIFTPQESKDPNGQFYASVIPIFPTDPQNENPYRIAVRDTKTGKVIGSAISEIEMTNPLSVQETSVVWTKNGQFVAFLMPSDRRTRVSRVFYVDSKNGRATAVLIQDYFQNMLGRINQVAPPEYYFEEVAPFNEDSLLIEVSAGSRAPQYSLLAEAVVHLVGDPHSKPFGKITSIKTK